MNGFKDARQAYRPIDELEEYTEFHQDNDFAIIRPDGGGGFFVQAVTGIEFIASDAVAFFILPQNKW